jgi:hypothetical protein
LSLSPYPKIFDYRLGGYSHWERWSRTRWYYQAKTSSYAKDERRKIYLSLYSKHFSDYSLLLSGALVAHPTKF